MSQGEKPAYQDRSRAARAKIVKALDEALMEKSFDQVSVSEIAERAGIAVGTVYRRFVNKEALLPVIFEIYQERLDEWSAGEGRIDIKDTDDLRTALRKIMHKTWGVAAKEAHLLRAVHLYVRLKPELGEGPEWKKYEEASAVAISQILKHYTDQIKRKNAKRTTAMVTYMLNAIFIEKALYPNEPPATLFPYNGKLLAEEVADMLYAYLQLSD